MKFYPSKSFLINLITQDLKQHLLFKELKEYDKNYIDNFAFDIIGIFIDLLNIDPEYTEFWKISYAELKTTLLKDVTINDTDEIEEIAECCLYGIGFYKDSYSYETEIEYQTEGEIPFPFYATRTMNGPIEIHITNPLFNFLLN